MMIKMVNKGKKGRLKIYCADCKITFVCNDSRFTNICPKCGTFLTVRKCTRCFYEWTPQNFDKLSSTCPKCKSPYWCRERTLDKRKNNGEYLKKEV